MRRLVTILATLGIAAACNPNASSAPELTDPHEILSRTIEATAGLRSMRVRFDLEVRDKAHPAAPQGGFAEGALDLGTGEMSLAGKANDGTGAFGYIVADGASFVRSSAEGRWTKIPAGGGMAAFLLIGGGGGGPQPDVPRALADLLDDPETSVELRGVEDCATGRCYRTNVGLSPAQVWKLVISVTGIDQMQGGGPAMRQPEGIPPVGLQVLTDTATLRLVEMVGSATMDGSSVAIRLRVAAPNELVSIDPPPPGLVDDMGAGFGGGGGGSVPGPAPTVAPLPVESVGP